MVFFFLRTSALTWISFYQFILYPPLSIILYSPLSCSLYPLLSLSPKLLDTEDSGLSEEEMTAEAGSVASDSHYFDDLSSLHLRWKSENEEPLGLLWFQLLRFYTVEFKASDHVITLKQSKVMERGKDWPGNRLALEREYTHRCTSLYGNFKSCHPSLSLYIYLLLYVLVLFSTCTYMYVLYVH